MTTLTGLTKGGLTWEPQFVTAINKDTCLGCGRCDRVCGRNVLMLQPMNEFGESSDEEKERNIERQVMTIANPGNCVGCEACARICPQKCHTHEPLTASTKSPMVQSGRSPRTASLLHKNFTISVAARHKFVILLLLTLCLMFDTTINQPSIDVPKVRSLLKMSAVK